MTHAHPRHRSLFLAAVVATASASFACAGDATPVRHPDPPVARAEIVDASIDAAPSVATVPPFRNEDVVDVRAGERFSCALLGAGTVWCWGLRVPGHGESSGPAYLPLPARIEVLPRAVELRVAHDQACARVEDGSVLCWKGSAGTPLEIAGISSARAIDVSEHLNCAVVGSGTVSCWGIGHFGAATIDRVDQPTPIAGITDAVEVHVGGQHACVRTRQGEVRCWGGNARGQLGIGTTSDAVRGVVSPVGLGSVEELGVGDQHTCARRVDGTVLCWGDGGSGQLGDATRQRSVPSLVEASTDAAALFIAGSTSCARLRTGTMVCWGAGSSGRFGDAKREDAHEVVPLPWSDLTQVSVGWAHACGVTRERRAFCWGNIADGRRGDGSGGDRPEPVEVASVAHAVQISAGSGFTMARLADGSLLGWGVNGSSELGIVGPYEVRRAAPLAHPLSGVIDVSSGDGTTCAIVEDGTARCWGASDEGQLGDGEPIVNSHGSIGARRKKDSPVTVVRLKDATRIAARNGHACARTKDATVWCWGANEAGQLGRGTTTPGTTPLRVLDLQGVTEVGSGGVHSCAIVRSGSLRCWGEGEFGQLGDGAKVNRWTPVTTKGIAHVQKLALGWRHSCALLEDGTARCWGTNDHGELGDGTHEDRLLPVAVAGLQDATAISGFDTTTCAIVQGGHVACWGAGQSGQLGNGELADHASPVAVRGVTDAVEVAVGNRHACARLRDGSVRCWGADRQGEAGDDGRAWSPERTAVLLPNAPAR